MKRFVLCLTVLAMLFSTVVMATALLISVAGGPSTLGGTAAIIGAPADVNDDAAFNTAQQGFTEQRGVTLPALLEVDAVPHTGPAQVPGGGAFIATGTFVDSHMIFMNTGPGENTTFNLHSNVVWTFDAPVLGVMSDYQGRLEIASSPLLGATGTVYPGVIFNKRGLQGGDAYTISGNTITLTMRLMEPGDWIRVVTASTIPEPSTFLLFGIGMLGILGIGYRRRKKAA